VASGLSGSAGVAVGGASGGASRRQATEPAAWAVMEPRLVDEGTHRPESRARVPGPGLAEEEEASARGRSDARVRRGMEPGCTSVLVRRRKFC
jgi:hypothetical protein